MDPRAGRRSALVAALALLLLLAAVRLALSPAEGAFSSTMLAAACSSAALALFSYSGALLLSGGAARALGFVPNRLSWRASVAAVLGTLGLSQLLDALLRYTGLYSGSVLRVVEERMAGAGANEIALALLALALAPALGEELFFRGLLLRGLRQRWGAAPALVATSLLFALLHLDLAQALAAALLGLYLGGFALRNDGIRLPILCHGINNAVALLLAAMELHEAGFWTLGLASIGLALGLRELAPRGTATRNERASERS